MARVNKPLSIETPIDLMLANKVVVKNHILLVRDKVKGKYVPLFYDGKRYVEDLESARIREFIKAEILMAMDQQYFKQRDYSKLNFFNSLTRQVLQNIKDLPGIKKEEDDFDIDPYQINTQNGIYNIQEDRLYQHSPDKYFRCIANARYMEGLTEEDYSDIFLDTVSNALYDKNENAQGNKEVIISFLQIISSFLIGNNDEKIIPIIVGPTNSGKSTILNTLKFILGTYADSFNTNSFIKSPRTDSDIRPDFIRMRLLRMAIAEETGKQKTFDNENLKKIAGNTDIAVRNPHSSNIVSFKFKGKLLLATNKFPSFTDIDDTAFLKRLVIIDFKNTVEDRGIDMELGNKLQSEVMRDKIFTQLLKIAHGYLRNKPELNKLALYIHSRFEANKTRILISQNTSVAQFWREHIVPLNSYFPDGNHLKHPVKMLYSVAYLAFCEKNDISPLSLEEFGKQFRKISDSFPGVNEHKGSKWNYYTGIFVNPVDPNNYNFHLIKYQTPFDFDNIRIEEKSENVKKAK